VGLPPVFGAPFAPPFAPAPFAPLVKDSPRTALLGQAELRVTQPDPFGCTAWLAAAAPEVDPEVVPDEPTTNEPLVLGAEVCWTFAESTPPSPLKVMVAQAF